METTKIQVKQSFPRLSAQWLSRFEQQLHEEFNFAPLPEDYMNFLLDYNGGIIYPNDLEDTSDAYQETVNFETPLVYNDGSIDTPSLIMLYTVWLEEQMRPLEDQIENWDIYSLIPSNHYSRDEYDILPKQMISIGLCNYEGSGGCISYVIIPRGLR